MLPEDDRMVETCRSVLIFFNVNFISMLVYYLNKLQNARYNDKDAQMQI